MKEKLQKLKQDKNLIRVIYIIGIIGIALIFCSMFYWLMSKKGNVVTVDAEKIVEEDRDIAYGKAVVLTQTEKKDRVVINHYGKNNKLVMQ